jgi:hypothetical protein
VFSCFPDIINTYNVDFSPSFYIISKPRHLYFSYEVSICYYIQFTTTSINLLFLFNYKGEEFLKATEVFNIKKKETPQKQHARQQKTYMNNTKKQRCTD